MKFPKTHLLFSIALLAPLATCLEGQAKQTSSSMATNASAMTPIPQEVFNLLKECMNEKYQRALFYLQQTNYFESQGLTGFTKFLKNKYTDKLSEATNIMNYLLVRGESTQLENVMVDTSGANLASASTIFTSLLQKEVTSTGVLNQIANTAQSKNDYQTVFFIEGLIKKQVRTEYLLARILKRVNFCKNDPGALINIDEELETYTINAGVISANYKVLSPGNGAVAEWIGFETEGPGVGSPGAIEFTGMEFGKR